jgi:hypothetical protein
MITTRTAPTEPQNECNSCGEPAQVEMTVSFKSTTAGHNLRFCNRCAMDAGLGLITAVNLGK